MYIEERLCRHNTFNIYNNHNNKIVIIKLCPTIQKMVPNVVLAFLMNFFIYVFSESSFKLSFYFSPLLSVSSTSLT